VHAEDGHSSSNNSVEGVQQCSLPLLKVIEVDRQQPGDDRAASSLDGDRKAEASTDNRLMYPCEHMAKTEDDNIPCEVVERLAQ